MSVNGRTILDHSTSAACIFAGIGEARMDMYRGNFEIKDYATLQLRSDANSAENQQYSQTARAMIYGGKRWFCN